MGSILAETVLVHRIEEAIVPIRDIFGAVFFISVGMMIDPAVIIEQWEAVLLITVVLMFGKVFVISLGTFLTGQSINTALRSGFSMAQIGEFSFIIATLGLALHAINDKLYPIIVAVSSITTFTTPYMIRLSGNISLFVKNNIPERVSYFMDSYSAWVYRVQSSSENNLPIGSVTIRLLANGILVAIIFTLTKIYVYPYFLELMHGRYYGKLSAEFFALVIASPFIWGMLFSYRYLKIPDYARTIMNPIVFIIWFLTLAEVTILSVINFHTLLTAGILLAIAAVFFFVAYRQLERSYHWFERRLVGNIGAKEIVKKSRFADLAPWETHFVEMDVGWNSPLIGKSLGDLQIRQRFGVNIVAIQRGPEAFLAPKRNAMIYPCDKLLVLGDDEQIEAFRSQVIAESSSEKELECAERLDDFILKPLLLEVGNLLIGQTIRNSRIREKWQGLVVGLERGGERILNPDPDTVLKADDLLLIVGSSQIINNSQSI